MWAYDTPLTMVYFLGTGQSGKESKGSDNFQQKELRYSKASNQGFNFLTMSLIEEIEL